MIDLDDFDPMGKQWDYANQSFVGTGSSDEVADEALRVVAAMLRACKGCPILPSLQEILWEYHKTISSNTLWSPTIEDADATLHQKLDLLSRQEASCDMRIDAVAIRSTKKMALLLKSHKRKHERQSTLSADLASSIIQDLIGHSFLDLSRAFSIGKRFNTPEQAFHFYKEVMESMEPGIIDMGKRLARRPTAERLKRFKIVQNEKSTYALLYDPAINLDNDASGW